MESIKNMSQDTKDWLTKRFGIEEKDIEFYNSGICYSRIGVNNEEAAKKVCENTIGAVNGGMFDGMRLGMMPKPTKNSAGIPIWDIKV